MPYADGELLMRHFFKACEWITCRAFKPLKAFNQLIRLAQLDVTLSAAFSIPAERLSMLTLRLGDASAPVLQSITVVSGTDTATFHKPRRSYASVTHLE